MTTIFSYNAVLHLRGTPERDLGAHLAPRGALGTSGCTWLRIVEVETLCKPLRSCEEQRGEQQGAKVHP
jgi:hypothetical protein